MHSIDYITLLIYDISSTLYDVTFTMCVTSHNDLISGTKHYMFMIYSLDMATGTVLWPHNHCVPSQPLCLTLHSMYFWPYRQYTNFMKSIECMSSQPLYVWNRLHYIWHHIHYIWHRIDAMSVTKSTLLMIWTLVTFTEKGQVRAEVRRVLYFSFYAFLCCLSFLILYLYYFIFNRNYMGKEITTFFSLFFLTLLWIKNIYILRKPTRPSRTNTQKRCPFHHRGLEWKNRKSRNTWSNRQIWPWSTEWSREKANRVLTREQTGYRKHPLPTT